MFEKKIENAIQLEQIKSLIKVAADKRKEYTRAFYSCVGVQDGYLNVTNGNMLLRCKPVDPTFLEDVPNNICCKLDGSYFVQIENAEPPAYERVIPRYTSGSKYQALVYSDIFLSCCAVCTGSIFNPVNLRMKEVLKHENFSVKPNVSNKIMIMTDGVDRASRVDFENGDIYVLMPTKNNAEKIV